MNPTNNRQANGKKIANTRVSVSISKEAFRHSPVLGQRLGQVLGKDDVTVLVELVAVLLAVFDAARHAHDLFGWWIQIW